MYRSTSPTCTWLQEIFSSAPCWPILINKDMQQPNHSRQVEILLVEDNRADVRLLMEGLAAARSRHRLSVVEDGEEALEFLYRRGVHAAAPRPDLVLLDLNLPRKDGNEVLRQIKSDPGLRRIPVVVLTSSRSERDVNTAYEYGANSYLRKPTDLKDIYDLTRTIEHYWLNLCVLPTAHTQPAGQ